MNNAVPARVVYVTPRGERDGVAERLEAAWPALSLLVADGVESAIEAVDPDVDAVLTRMDLADGTGLDVQQRLNPTGRTLPVVLLADETTPERAARAVEQDVAAYLPVEGSADVGRVVATLEDVIGEHPDGIGEPPTEKLTVSDLAPSGEQSETEWKVLLLDQLFSRLPVHLFVKDREARHVLVSEAFVDDPEEYLGRRDIDVEYVTASEARPAYEDDIEVIESGEPIIDEEEYYPSTDRWFLTSKVPLYGPDGEVTGLIGISREITDRKQAERDLARKNERLDRFASVVSHDLRNPLSVADGNLELLAEEYDDPRLDAVDDALERMSSLIDELLSLAQQGEMVTDLEPVSLEGVATECWGRVATGDAALAVEESTTFLAGQTQIRQLLENLFRNAVEHAGPDVTVTVGTLENAIGFYVADDGPGIDRDEADDVFEPGYTTDEDGTGLGLHIVREVAREHDWTLTVTESVDGGARFEFRDIETPS